MFSSRIKVFSVAWVSQLAVRFASRGEGCAGRTGRHGLHQAGGRNAGRWVLWSRFHLAAAAASRRGNRKLG